MPAGLNMQSARSRLLQSKRISRWMTAIRIDMKRGRKVSFFAAFTAFGENGRTDRQGYRENAGSLFRPFSIACIFCLMKSIKFILQYILDIMVGILYTDFSKER